MLANVDLLLRHQRGAPLSLTRNTTNFCRFGLDGVSPDDVNIIGASPLTCITIELWVPKTPSDFKINKIRGLRNALLHG